MLYQKIPIFLFSDSSGTYQKSVDLVDYFFPAKSAEFVDRMMLMALCKHTLSKK